jgi:DNA-binding winged helix-turn-helix (wHTH) protein/Tfp pilus assembly protein PilF
MRTEDVTNRHQYEFSGFRLDTLSRELYGPDGAVLPLTSKALDVLAYLVEHRQRVVDKAELLTAVWAGRVVEENNLTQAISALRRTFGVGAGEHRYILTIPRRGYRFVGQPDAEPLTERRRATDATTPAEAAKHLYLAGRDLVDAPSLARCKRAIGVFRQVLDLDPRYARAWSGLAFAWRALTITGDLDPKQAFPLARAAVQHSLALAPDLPEAHAGHGYILFWHDWDWHAAEQAMQQAIHLDPRVPDGHFAYANLLSSLGRFEEALTQARQARELDPVSPLVNTVEGAILAAAGRYDEAGTRITHALEIAPEFWVALLARAGMALAGGDPAAAIATLETAAKVCGRNSRVLAALAAALVANGNRSRAQQLHEELQALAEATYVPSTSRAAISHALGRHDEALDLLELAFEQRDVRMIFLKTDARWNKLRTQPRFEALMGRLGFTTGTARGIL